MANNNTEATTFIKYSNASGNVFSYDSLVSGFNTSDSHQDQIEVVREFAWNSTLGTEPTGEEKKTVYTLPYASQSGSPMYTIDTTAKTITFSTTTTDYEWIVGQHHSRTAGTVTLPVFSDGDTVTIRRKTPIQTGDKKWTTGAKVTAARLNSQFTQLLNVAQEVRSFLLNPQEFDTFLGSASGICPLDSNAKVALKYIPYSLGGGSGESATDITGNTLGELSNVDETTNAPSDILNTLVYDTDVNKWVPKAALTGIVDTTSASANDILKWTGTTWALSAFSLANVTDVTLNSALKKGDVFFHNGTNWTDTNISSALASGDAGKLLIWDGTALAWKAQAWTSTVTADDLNNHPLSELSDVKPYPDVQTNDFLAYKASDSRWFAKSVDIYDLNDVTSPNGEFDQNPDIPDGHVLVWDSNLEKQDGATPKGCWTYGEFGYKTDGINLDTASNNDVLKMTSSPDGWSLAPLNLNHLGDVVVPTTQDDEDQVQIGDFLRWDGTRWHAHPMSSGATGGDGRAATGTIHGKTFIYDGGQSTPSDTYYVFRAPVDLEITGDILLMGARGTGESIPTATNNLKWEIQHVPMPFTNFQNAWGGENWDNFLPQELKTNNNKLNAKRTVGSTNWELTNFHNNGKVMAGEALVIRPTRCYTPVNGGLRGASTLQLNFKEI